MDPYLPSNLTSEPSSTSTSRGDYHSSDKAFCDFNTSLDSQRGQAVTAMQSSSVILSNMITDYVGSPKTERRRLLIDPNPFTSRQGGPIQVIPVLQPSSAPSLGFRHSSNIHRQHSTSPSYSPGSQYPNPSYPPKFPPEKISRSPKERILGFPHSVSAPMSIPKSVPRAVNLFIRPIGPSSSGQSSGFPRTPQSEPLTPATQPSPIEGQAVPDATNLLDDDELSLPFAVDSDEDSFRRPREPLALGASSDPPSQSGTSIRQLSQDAALGIFVRDLKSALPLRSGSFVQSNLLEDSSFVSREVDHLSTPLSQLEVSLKHHEDLPGGNFPFAVASPGTSSTLMKKKSTEILQDLKEYSHIKETLLRQRGSIEK